MSVNESGSRSVLARAVAAEIRSRMAAQRVSGKRLAERVGMSQNYFATRLRDEKPFTLDDIAAIARELDGSDGHTFIVEANARHSDRVFAEDFMLAARDTDDDVEAAEQQQEA